MTEVRNLLRALAPEHVDHLLGSKRKSTRLLAPENTGHQLAGGLRTVPLLRRIEAVIAVVTRLAGLVKVIKQRHSSACSRLTQPENRIELGRNNTLVRRGTFGLLDHP